MGPNRGKFNGRKHPIVRAFVFCSWQRCRGKSTRERRQCIVFELSKDKLANLNEQLRLAPEVMRFLIVKTKKKTAEELAQDEKIQEKIQAKKKEAVKKELADAEKKEEEAKAPTKPVKKEEEKSSDERVSMDDLDKKLDEILDESLDI